MRACQCGRDASGGLGFSRASDENRTAETATNRPSTRYPVRRWSEKAEPISAPRVEPIGSPMPTAADALPRAASGTRSGTTEVRAAWKTFITAWPRHQAMVTSRTVRTPPSSAIAPTAARPPPSIHGLRRPLRSERAPAIGLKIVAKTALTPLTRPSIATLSALSICSIWSGSSTLPTPT